MTKLEKDALSGAYKICAYGQCFCARHCDHKNHDDALSGCDIYEKAGFNVKDPCPLYKYNIKPDTRSVRDQAMEDDYLTDEEIFAICACCKNGKIVPYDEEYDAIDYIDETYCHTCPVYLHIESIYEDMAEE